MKVNALFGLIFQLCKFFKQLCLVVYIMYMGRGKYPYISNRYMLIVKDRVNVFN